MMIVLIHKSVFNSDFNGVKIVVFGNLVHMTRLFDVRQICFLMDYLALIFGLVVAF